MKNKTLVLICICFFLSPALVRIEAHSNTLVAINKYSEKEKIELLLEAIKTLKDVKFERNGSIHETDAAISLMKKKLNKVGVDNLTAQEFIDKIASKSSMSGKSYFIVYPDGHKIASGEFLKKKLAQIEGQ